MKSSGFARSLFSVVLSIAASTLASAETLSWSQLSKMPLPPPALRLAYGAGPQQFGELRVPQGKGPFPVVVLIHGGCWQNEFDYVYMTRLAAWLTDRGLATWTIEYRRIGDAGGGWPGTFRDAAMAADFVRRLAPEHHLDLKRVLAAGHSAGGQLALWLAARPKIPAASELYLKEPLAIHGVLALDAITDLAQYRVGPADSCNASVDALLGGDPAKFPRRYAETSPRQLLPLGVPQVFLQGEIDPIVEPASVRAYVGAATKAGDRAILLTIPGAGHFESVAPIPSTIPLITRALHTLLP